MDGWILIVDLLPVRGPDLRVCSGRYVVVRYLVANDVLMFSF